MVFSKYSFLFPITASVLFTNCTNQVVKKDTRPNILLILADDLGYSDLGCFGSEIETPNLDLLASKGMRMTQFYNASRSCPSRACLLTGLYPHQAGMGDMVTNLGTPAYQGYLNKECVTIAEALKIAGYNTYMSGKWHVGSKPDALPLARGFDHFFGLIDGASSYFDNKRYRLSQKQDMLFMLENENYSIPDSGFYLTDAIADNALRFLDMEKEKPESFFFYLAFTAPHWPIHALPEDIAKYRGKYMQGWDSIREIRYKKMIKLGIIDTSCKLSPRDPKVPDWNTLNIEDKQEYDLKMAVYAAMIDRMDQNIGKVINKLIDLGELDNTLIIFLSDNGGCHEEIANSNDIIQRFGGEIGSPNSFESIGYPWANVCNTPFRLFKHWINEGGIATPFIACYPKIIKGNSINNIPFHIKDIMSTCLDFANTTYPDSLNGKKIIPTEGISLVPFLKGKSTIEDNHPVLFWEHEGNKGVRKGDWKLVSIFDTENNKPGAWELYNIRDDRSELNNQITNYPNIVLILDAWYRDWATKCKVIPREELKNTK